MTGSTLRRGGRRLAALLVPLLLVGGLAGTGSAAGDVVISPRGLPRGADAAIPRLVGSDVVVGDLRLPVPGEPLEVVDAGDHYVVLGIDLARGSLTSYSVAPGREPIRLRTGEGSVTISSDGRRLITREPARGARGLTLRLVDTATGQILGARRMLARYDVVDAGGTRVLMSDLDAGTLEWNALTGYLRKVSAQPSIAASYAANRVAVIDGVTRSRPCERTLALDAPQTVLSSSCRWLTGAIAPDGRAAQFDPAAGDERIRVADPDGRTLDVYSTAAPTTVVLQVAFPDADSIRFRTVTPRTSTYVECRRAVCERVAPYERIEDLVGSGRRIVGFGAATRHVRAWLR
ncbi:hypothetical protein K8Z61_07675 [Nocardioides sp. TRM66260-LWL]|uniref:hypothetical protein n=1 Tax=Nocardioides sp. TRM66260-LWL TaxID=2874478 RepID=UPI001CC370E4|nr:hypothetical protein [Nocardioides sp. TRM66260-LWL]MBZ5734373.1 hypothetical protein [Nocardioides sp. TRM66260-LWL]